MDGDLWTPPNSDPPLGFPAFVTKGSEILSSFRESLTIQGGALLVKVLGRDCGRPAIEIGPTS